MSKLRSDELVNMEGDGAPSFPQGATSIEPTANNQVATKSYVDSAVSASLGNSVSDTAPANPVPGSFWTDTSVSPRVLKTWDGSSWIEFAGAAPAFTGLTVPPVEVLTPLNGAGLNDGESFTPLSSVIAAVGEAGTIAKETDEIQSIADETSIHTNNAILTGSIYPGAGGVNYMFDGTTSSCGPTAPAYVTFTPSTPITISSSLRIRANVSNTSVDADFAINGSAVSTVSTGFPGSGFIGYPASTWTTISNPPSSLTSLRFGWPSGGSWMSLSGIEIDGVELIDGISPVKKVLSFPTSTNFDGLSVGDVAQTEYATWDSTTAGGTQSSTFSADNLTVTTSNSAVTHIVSTLAFPTSGKWYVELTIDALNYLMAGLIADSNDTNYPVYLNQKTESYVYYLNSDFYGNNSGYSTGSIPSISAGDVLGILLDMDNQELRYSVNGTLYGGFNSVTNTVPLALAISDHDSSSSTVTLNTGQSPWAHEPPSGYLGLSAPAATITAIDASGPSQTTEYATLNPSDKSTAITLSNGNLSFSHSESNRGVRATMGISSGKYYWEVTNTSAGNGNFTAGIANSSWTLTYVGANNGYGFASQSGFYPASGTNANVNANTTGDVVGFAFDADAGTLETYVNGVNQYSAAGWGTIPSGTWYPAFGSGANGTQTVNFGATAFTHTPPSGYVGLSETVTTYPNVTVDGGTWDTSNQSQVWSSGLTTPSNSFNGGQPATSAFDGDLSTFAGAGSIGEDIVFQPTIPVSYTDSIEVYTAQAGQMILNSDSPVATTDATGWVTLVSGSSGSINTITIDPNSNRRATLHAIRVDGQLLVDAIEDSQVWSANVTNEHSTYTASEAFAGSVSSSNYWFNNGSPSILTLNPGLDITDKTIVVYGATVGNNDILINDIAISGFPGSTNNLTPVDITTALAGQTTLTKIEVRATTAAFQGIKVDGKLLVDAGVRDLGDRKLSSSVSYEKSLTFADTTEFTRLISPLSMTDANGDVVTPVSDTIANVSGNVLTLQGNTNLTYFLPGDEVQPGVQVVSVDAAAPSITVDGGSWLGADGSGSAYEISNSLRFNQSDVASLSKTFTSAGNRKTWTWSSWVKLGKLSSGYHNLFANLAGNTNGLYVYFNDPTDSKLYIVDYNLSGGASLATSRVFRDHSAWYHIVIAFDTTQATAADRVKVYVNGVQETLTGQQPNQNSEGQWNQGSRTHYIGRQTDSTTAYTFNGYLAEVHFVDGQALAPTAFGDFDANNVWQAKEFEGQYNIGEATGIINTIKITGNGPHGFHAIRVDGNILVNSSSRNYSNNGQYTTTTSFPYANNQPAKGFDGSIAGPNVPYSAGGEITWAPTGGVTYNSKVEIYVGGVNPFYYNLNDAGPVIAPINSWTTIAEAPSPGVNGFYLDFSDSSSDAALGYDAAGSNNWTVNNLTAVSTWNQDYVWSDYWDAPMSAGDGRLNAFDGRAEYRSYSANTFSTWTSPVTLPVNTQLRVRSHTYTPGLATDKRVFEVNGINYYHLLPAYVPGEVPWVVIPVTELTSIKISGYGSGYEGSVLGGVEIDGIELIDQGVFNPELIGIDSVPDTPTSNYATLNPLDKESAVSLTNGNLDVTVSSTGYNGVKGTLGVTSGKYYFEATANGAAAAKVFIGICSSEVNVNASGYIQDSSTERAKGMLIFCDNGQYQLDGNSRTNYSTSMANGDVLGVAYDLDGNTVQFYKNGNALGSIDISSSPLASTTIVPFYVHYNSNTTYHLNFGQRPFVYYAPIGHKALTTDNLPEPSIKDGSKHFDVVKYEGNSGTNVISGLGFSPDLVWIKGLDGYSHCLFDTLRGAGKRLATDGSWAEDDYNLLNSFNSDGFTLGTTAGGGAYVQNTTGSDAVAWCWNAGDTTETIAAGSLNSSVYDQSQTWSNNAVTTGANGNWSNLSNFFNGDLDNYGHANTNGSPVEVTVTFNPPLEVSNTVTFYGVIGGASASAVWKINNETEYAIANQPSHPPSLPINSNTISFTGSMSSITLTKTTSDYSGLYCYGLEVDGKLLVDYGVSVDTVPSINSVVKANPEAGFSIVSYTGDNAASGTISHGLASAPEFIIIKSRNVSDFWPVYHSGLGTNHIKLNDTAGAGVDLFGSEPTSSVFSVGTGNEMNGNYDYIAYCFAPVEGYSAMGSYTGNGSADGPFVYTGFKPAWIMIKSTDGDEHWRIVDSTRDPVNPADAELYANTSGAETDSDLLDFLSNGFKIKVSFSGSNANGHNYIYMAFAENPLNTPPEVDTSGDTQVALDPLAAIATDILEIDGTTMYLNGATDPWRTGLYAAGPTTTFAAPSPAEIEFTSMNQSTTPYTGAAATLASRTWTLESSNTSTGPWTLVDTYVDYDVLASQDGATPWITSKPILSPNTFYRVKVAYNATNADIVESIYHTFKTGNL